MRSETDERTRFAVGMVDHSRTSAHARSAPAEALGTAFTVMSRGVNGYLRSSRLLQRVVSAQTAAFTGFWLGVIGRNGLADLDRHIYERASEDFGGVRARYSDDEHNQRGLFEWESQAIERHFPRSAAIAVTGAGGGREVLGLRALGFEVTGYEPNRRLVEAGARLFKELGEEGRLRLCERDRFPDLAQCDAVVVGWGSYMLIPSARRRVAFLRGARAAIPEGAPILLSFFVRRGDESRLRLIANVGNLIRRLRRDEPIEIGDALGPNFIHHFTRDEIESEATAADLRIISFATEPYPHAIAVAAARRD